MTGNAPQAGTDRVAERRRALALARHYREFDCLTIQQIGDRLGRAPATVKAYFYDPTGEKARAVKARYQGVCRGCSAYTQPRNGNGDARVRVLRGVPPRGDRAALVSRACNTGDGRTGDGRVGAAVRTAAGRPD